jgi:hypothetical protein
MFYIDSTEKLRETIQLLEVERTDQKELLRKDFQHAYDQFKPLSLIKNTILGIGSLTQPGVNIISSTLSLATGYLTKKLIIGHSDNKLRMFLGSLVQLGVATLIVQRSRIIESVGRQVLQTFLFRKTKTI